MGSSLYLSDIIERVGLSIKDVILLRHPISHWNAEKHLRDENMRKYTSIQKENFPQKSKYWLVFIGESGTSAKLVACYKCRGSYRNDIREMPPGYSFPDLFEENGLLRIFDLEETDLFSDLYNRLIIEWGSAAIKWYQYATNEKEVLAIQENSKYKFTNYEDVILDFSDLQEVLRDPILYENWHNALQSVYAIYLIVDKTNGKQYIGSAYGEGGLLGRWKTYIDTYHGNNKLMMDLIGVEPERYKSFQFSVLQIVPKTASDKDVKRLEDSYKRKLLTRQYGMNAN